MNKILIIIPAFNEELNIVKVLDEIRTDVPYMDALVINDASKDGTEKVLKAYGADFISHPYNLGYSAALQTGFKYAAMKGYDYVVQFDGDGQHIPSEIGRMFARLQEKGHDIIIGSRFKGNTGYQQSFFRKLGTTMFTKIIRTFCNAEITDPTSGFQILTREVYTKYSRMSNFPDYPDANLIIEMIYDGYDIGELDVRMRLREFGESMHSGVIGPIKYMVKMFYSILLIIIARYTRGMRRK